MPKHFFLKMKNSQLFKEKSEDRRFGDEHVCDVRDLDMLGAQGLKPTDERVDI